jgi:osmotically inducible lipoprotein OsmB
MKRGIAFITVMMLLFGLSLGCTNMSKTQQGALTGGMIGAGGGAALAAIAGGNPAVGAAVGGGVGLITGGIIGKSKE